MKIEPGNVVVAILHSPREKLLGVLDEINAAGIALRAIELGYFDDWCRSIAASETALEMSDQFIPMWRVERISKDETASGVASMEEQFETRTGLKFREQ